LHGGPGAQGEMKPVAQELASNHGVLEPLQTRDSIEGQIQELKITLEEHAALPVILAGYSWGAWLAFLTASRHPSLVRKLILISSGPFEEKYAGQILQTRLGRLSPKERAEAKIFLGKKSLSRGEFTRLGELMALVDDYDPLPMKPEGMDLNPVIFEKVWKEAAELRKKGKLLEAAKRIQCPVVAIHGDHDPHPAAGVKEPLEAALTDLRFILLDRCGHTPWMEKRARENFFRVFEENLF